MAKDLCSEILLLRYKRFSGECDVTGLLIDCPQIANCRTFSRNYIVLNQVTLSYRQQSKYGSMDYGYQHIQRNYARSLPF